MHYWLQTCIMGYKRLAEKGCHSLGTVWAVRCPRGYFFFLPILILIIFLFGSKNISLHPGGSLPRNSLVSISVQKFAHYAFCKSFNQGQESFANSTTGVTNDHDFEFHWLRSFYKYEVNQSLQARYTRHLFVEQMSESKVPSGHYLGQRANRRSQTRSGAPITKANKKVVAYCCTTK